MRLTDRRRAAVLKDIITRMESGGYDVAEENKIYVKLAEYENGKRDATKYAKWEINSDGYYPYCSNCLSEPPAGEMTDYCSKCGAYMKEDKDDA